MDYSRNHLLSLSVLLLLTLFVKEIADTYGCASQFPGYNVPQSDMHCLGGTSNRAITLNDCQLSCTNDDTCQSFDWDPNNDAGNLCWMIPFNAANTYYVLPCLGATHYVKNKTCMPFTEFNSTSTPPMPSLTLPQTRPETFGPSQPSQSRPTLVSNTSTASTTSSTTTQRPTSSKTPVNDAKFTLIMLTTMSTEATSISADLFFPSTSSTTTSVAFFNPGIIIGAAISGVIFITIVVIIIITVVRRKKVIQPPSDFVNTGNFLDTNNKNSQYTSLDPVARLQSSPAYEGLNAYEVPSSEKPNTSSPHYCVINDNKVFTLDRKRSTRYAAQLTENQNAEIPTYEELKLTPINNNQID